MRNETEITCRLLSWYDAHKRVLPFRGTKDPYRVWVSEIMLQQTRAATVAAYYERFLNRFPDVYALAKAPEEDVLKLWEGLGYYSRARMLHRTAKIVAETGFPDTFEGLRALPGIGDYTAAAIASIAFGIPVPAMDGNLTRVLARLFDIADNVRIPSVARALREHAASLMPQDRPGDMNQALMDLGATICLPGTPDCDRCPLRALCLGYASGEPELLPLLPDKKPPTPVAVAVTIVTHGPRVLVTQRREALLRNLYVFALSEDGNTPDHAAHRLAKWGVDARFVAALGSAKHIFTHRVWQMRIYHYEADKNTDIPGGRWVTAGELAALPLPTAMKAARAHAMSILNERKSDTMTTATQEEN